MLGNDYRIRTQQRIESNWDLGVYLLHAVGRIEKMKRAVTFFTGSYGADDFVHHQRRVDSSSAGALDQAGVAEDSTK
jgi:hypothetical protein